MQEREGRGGSCPYGRTRGRLGVRIGTFRGRGDYASEEELLIPGLRVPGLGFPGGLAPRTVLPRGGVRSFHQKSTCLTQLTLGPNMLHSWSRITLKLRGGLRVTLATPKGADSNDDRAAGAERRGALPPCLRAHLSDCGTFWGLGFRTSDVASGKGLGSEVWGFGVGVSPRLRYTSCSLNRYTIILSADLPTVLPTVGLSPYGIVYRRASGSPSCGLYKRSLRSLLCVKACFIAYGLECFWIELGRSGRKCIDYKISMITDEDPVRGLLFY